MPDQHPSWMSIPASGPIADVLKARREWIEHLSTGSEGTRRTALKDLADGGRTEDRIRQGYTGRAAIELLQNAHDAMADEGVEGTVRFVVTSSALLVANEGRPFDEERIGSLTRLGSSHKRVDGRTTHQIGYKGIGFTSVFEISDEPQVMSRPVGFKFNRAAARRLVQRSLGSDLDGPVPARYFPLPINREDLDPDFEVVVRLFDEGAASVVRAPFRNGEIARDVERMVRETIRPQLLLFLPAVESLTYQIAERQHAYKRKESGAIGAGQLVRIETLAGRRSSWLVKRGTVEADPTLLRALDDPFWRDVKSLNAAVAIPWGERGPHLDPKPQRLFSYFPTDDRLGRGVVIHGDFYLDSTRRRIETRGLKGKVSELVWSRACGLAAELAASIAPTWGARALGACVPIGHSDELGEVIGSQLENSLAAVNVARPADGSPPTLASHLRRVDRGSRARADWLTPMMEGASGLLHPEDDAGPTGDLLERLGCMSLSPAETAKRLDGNLSGRGYPATLRTLARWLRTLDEMQQERVLEALRHRPIVMDTSDAWVAPANVNRRGPDRLSMPIGLDRPELREVRTHEAKWLLDRLRIQPLNPATALDRLLEAVATMRFPSTDSECTGALDLAWKVWTLDPGLLASKRPQLGRIPVPARTPRARSSWSWRPAGEVYFGRLWGYPSTEQLYGHLGAPEFLAEAPPKKVRARKQREQFYETLGVTRLPRIVDFDEYARSHQQTSEWRRSSENAPAWTCGDGHQWSGRSVSSPVVDRLDAVLKRAEEQAATAAALAAVLAEFQVPYGPQATVTCTNSSHYGRRGTAKTATGYQRWRLQRSRWIPVSGSADGSALEVPGRAWWNVPRSTPWLLVARARLTPVQAERLELVAADRPTPDAIETALATLRDAYPALGSSPMEVHRTAEWLARRLDLVLRTSSQASGSPPPLPATGIDGSVWSTSPVTANVPGLPRLPGIEVLAPGRWIGLRRAYGLRAASDVVILHPNRGRARTVTRLLGIDQRVHLLALLLRRPGNHDRIAARLAALKESPVAHLSASWEVRGNVTEPLSVDYLLVPKRDSRQRVIRAELLWAVDGRPDHVELGRALAEHFEEPEIDSEIALYLADAVSLTRSRGITPGEIDDARELLRSKRYARELERDEAPRQLGGDMSSIISRSIQSGEWSDPGAASGGSGSVDSPEPGSTRPARRYVEPDKTRFRPGRIVAGKAPKSGGSNHSSPQSASGATSPPVTQPAPMPPREAADPFQASTVESERRAVAIVGRFGRGLPDVVQVVDVQSDGKGWDLEFHLEGGAIVPVEVKGTTGAGPFVITANELRQAKRNPSYVLYQVIHLADPSKVRMRVFRDLGSALSEEHRVEAGWVVSGWQSIDHEEIPIDVVEDD